MDVVVDLEVLINQAITRVNPTRASISLGLIRQLPATPAARGKRRLYSILVCLLVFRVALFRRLGHNVHEPTLVYVTKFSI